MAWTRTDDLDQSTPAEPVTFGFDGVAYIMDLSAANKDQLGAALAPFTSFARVYGDLPPLPADQPDASDPKGVQQVARRTRRPKTTHLSVTASPDPVQTLNGNGKDVVTPSMKSIREWANTNGYALPTRGRIPDAVLSEYTKAHTEV